MQDQKVKLEDIVSLIEQDRVALIAKLNDDSDFKRAWRHNISGYFYKGIWEKLDIAKDDNGVQTNKPMNEMSRWYGNVGGGKSVASLFVVYLEREFFGFDYATLFSQMEASMWLVDKTYEANIEGKELVRCTLNIDEDRRMFGAGSVQEENFFDEFTEFLRQRQINIHVLNPNDIHSVDVQFEVIGYTNENYCKSIMYQKIDKRNGVLAAIAGIFSVSRFNSAPPYGYAGVEMTAICAAVIGGTSMNGGEGTIFGAVLGIAMLAVIETATNLLEISPYLKDLITGAILLTAVSIDMLSHRKRA